MSIRDDDGKEILQLSKIWAWSFKLLMVMVPFVALTLFSWGTWVTVTIFDHASQIRLLHDRATRSGGGNISGASINVGKAEDIAESAREYLTVQEVADRESKDERTILLWIEGGRIDPAPVKTGKSWAISEDYRILPQVSANNRKPAAPP
jgi:hypothetical protein